MGTCSSLRRRMMMGCTGELVVNPNYLILPMEIEFVGKYIAPNTGVITNASGYVTTYAYEIPEFDSVQIFPEFILSYSAVYDENYNWLGHASEINNANIKSVYPTAKYLRFSNTSANMVNPFVVFYNTTNYVQGNYIMPETANIKLVKPKMDVRGKYIDASGVISNGGNQWCTLKSVKILADRYIPFQNHNRNYSGAYTEDDTWLFNLSSNRSIQGRDPSASYVKGSDQYNNTLLPYYFATFYNFENMV